MPAKRMGRLQRELDDPKATKASREVGHALDQVGAGPLAEARLLVASDPKQQATGIPPNTVIDASKLVKLKIGQNTRLKHGLGRAPRGWLIVDVAVTTAPGPGTVVRIYGYDDTQELVLQAVGYAGATEIFAKVLVF